MGLPPCESHLKSGEGSRSPRARETGHNGVPVRPPELPHTKIYYYPCGVDWQSICFTGAQRSECPIPSIKIITKQLVNNRMELILLKTGSYVARGL